MSGGMGEKEQVLDLFLKYDRGDGLLDRGQLTALLRAVAPDAPGDSADDLVELLFKACAPGATAVPFTMLLDWVFAPANTPVQPLTCEPEAAAVVPPAEEKVAPPAEEQVVLPTEAQPIEEKAAPPTEEQAAPAAMVAPPIVEQAAPPPEEAVVQKAAPPADSEENAAVPLAEESAATAEAPAASPAADAPSTREDHVDAQAAASLDAAAGDTVTEQHDPKTKQPVEPQAAALQERLGEARTERDAAVAKVAELKQEVSALEGERDKLKAEALHTEMEELTTSAEEAVKKCSENLDMEAVTKELQEAKAMAVGALGTAILCAKDSKASEEEADVAKAVASTALNVAIDLETEGGNPTDVTSN